MCRIYDGKNGAAGTHGSINFHEVQIVPPPPPPTHPLVFGLINPEPGGIFVDLHYDSG